MIEVSDEWLRQKVKEAKGEAPFTKDALLDCIASGGLDEYRKLPGRWQTIVGLHGEAKRRAEALATSGA
jgi:hypothetical protein